MQNAECRMQSPPHSAFSIQHSAFAPLLAAAVFAALAVAMTWPLAAHLGTAVAWPGDPFINIWILDWDWYATFHQPLSLFQANVFYPAKLPLAYSENLYGIAIFLFPFRALGVPPIAAATLAMLLGYAFSGFGAYVLGRYITSSWYAGLAAGIFYAFVPFRITHAAHVQHVWAGWLPLLIVALLHYAKQPTWPRAALFAAAFLLNGLANIHWLLFGTVAIAITFLLVRPRVLPIATCTLAAALLLAPFLIPYAKVAREYNMRRTWQETKSFSAEPRDWLPPPLAAIAFSAELCAAPMLWYLAVPTPPVYAAVTHAHAILELPIGTVGDYAAMLHATAPHRPIVNGSSGFTPPETLHIESLIDTDALVPELQRIGVDTVLVHGDAVSEATRQWLGRAPLAFRGGYDGGVAADRILSTPGRPHTYPDCTPLF